MSRSMTAVERLKAIVAVLGYTQSEVDALRALAAAGIDEERSAQLLLSARAGNVNPVQLAEVMIRRSGGI